MAAAAVTSIGFLMVRPSACGLVLAVALAFVVVVARTVSQTMG
jgi:hypothetical protein